MKKKKDFDCVEMKNQIQAQIARENEGLTDEEIREKRRLFLETSDNEVARAWRWRRERNAACQN